MDLVGPNGGTIVKVRPGSWLEALPAPWNEDPNVLLVYAPRNSFSRIIHTRDDKVLGVLEHDDRVTGLQVIYPQLNTYLSHEEIFTRAKIPMTQVQFIGRLSQAPQAMFVMEDFVPIIFQSDAMWRPYLDVTRYVGAITKELNKELN